MAKQEEKGNEKWGQIFCGVAVGTANSLFGGGGGMLAVPMLERTGLPSRRAHATAILLILPISLFSFFFYAIKGVYDFSVLLPTAIGVSAGGILGAKLLNKLPVTIIGRVFAVLQFLAGLFLLFGR